MAVGVGIEVRKLPLFAKIFHCFFLSQVSLHVSDCAALYMLQKFAFAKRMERIFCELSECSCECSCEWIEKRTSSSLLMLLFLSAFLNQLNNPQNFQSGKFLCSHSVRYLPDASSGTPPAACRYRFRVPARISLEKARGTHERICILPLRGVA